MSDALPARYSSTQRVVLGIEAARLDVEGLEGLVRALRVRCLLDEHAKGEEPPPPGIELRRCKRALCTRRSGLIFCRCYAMCIYGVTPRVLEDEVGWTQSMLSGTNMISVRLALDSDEAQAM
ncbi:hypothetical protein V8C44DRAFT_80362 [Trichoderma aethiopicum]